MFIHCTLMCLLKIFGKMCDKYLCITIDGKLNVILFETISDKIA